MQSCSLRHYRGNDASERGRIYLAFHQPIPSQYISCHALAALLTLSLSNLQISADPAFVTGMTLMREASRTALALIHVNKASILTFHLVESQVKDCSVTIEPAQTNVHSDPFIYVLYRSSDR